VKAAREIHILLKAVREIQIQLKAVREIQIQLKLVREKEIQGSQPLLQVLERLMEMNKMGIHSNRFRRLDHMNDKIPCVAIRALRYNLHALIIILRWSLCIYYDNYKFKSVHPLHQNSRLTLLVRDELTYPV
jgi:hypothetical protein